MSEVQAPVILIGFMAVGKSTVGKALAKEWGVPFVDTDQLIEKKHGSIASIFSSFSEPYFRTVEATTVATTLGKYANKPVVIALGGGAVLDTGTQQLLAEHTVVFLDTDLEHVQPRIAKDQHRPLLTSDPLASWSALAERRRPVYERVHSLRVDTRGKELESIVQEITEKVRQL